MRRLASLLPLLLTGSACEWFTGPEPQKTVWYATHSGRSYAQPALVGDTLYVATGDGQVIARNARTGAALWSASVGTGRVWGGNLLVVAGAVVVPVLHETRALDAQTGQPLWSYSAPLDTVGGGSSSPGVVTKVRIAAKDSTVFIPAWGGTVAAVHARTGSVRWQWKPPALPHRFGAQGVAVAGTTVYVSVWHFLDTYGVASEGRVVALDAATGTELWQTVLPTPESVVCLSGAPAVAGNIIAVSTLNGRVYGLDRSNGSLLWSVPQEPLADGAQFVSVLTGAVAVNDTIYADAGTQQLRGILASTGKVIWRASYPSRLSSEMTIAGSRIYGPDFGDLYVFDRSSGQVVQRLVPPGAASQGVFAASVAVNETLVFAPVNGGVWAFPR